MLAPALSLLAGTAIVVQNAVMVAMAARGIGLTGALLFNSLVGVSLLIAIEAGRGGTGFASALLAQARPWFVLPGLLGTLFVFASLYGYRHQGATATIVLIVAAQLAAGLLFDALGVTAAARPPSAERLVGIALVLAGAVLVLRDGAGA